MKFSHYVIGIIVSIFFSCYGILGWIDTVISYKYEVDDPIVDIYIKKLDKESQKLAYNELAERERELDWQFVFFMGLSLLGLVFLLYFVLNKKKIIFKETFDSEILD